MYKRYTNLYLKVKLHTEISQMKSLANICKKSSLIISLSEYTDTRIIMF
jgi:hypothetical protein